MFKFLLKYYLNWLTKATNLIRLIYFLNILHSCVFILKFASLKWRKKTNTNCAKVKTLLIRAKKIQEKFLNVNQSYEQMFYYSIKQCLLVHILEFIEWYTNSTTTTQAGHETHAT